MKKLFFCLLAVLLVRTADIGRACEYCRMAAEDPEAARLALAAHASSGAFPLQSTINQFKSDPPAILTAPPAVGTIATSAADLPAHPRRLPPPMAKTVPVAPVAPKITASPAPTRSATTTSASLLGFLGFLGLVVWRTRRTHPADSTP